MEHFIGNVMNIEGYYRYLTAMQLSKIATYGGKMLEKQDTTIIKEEIHTQRNDFKEVFMIEVSEIRVEIAKIKNTLARMQAEA